MVDCELVDFDNGIELLPLPGVKAKVWQHFGLQARSGEFLEKGKRKRNEVLCKLCLQPLKYCGNMMNLLFHFKNKHPSGFKEITGESTGGSLPGSSSRTSTTTIKPADPTQVAQPTLPAAIQAMLPLPKSSIRYIKITNVVCYFLARDMQPYDTVNDVGFRQMLKVLEPRYFPLDRKTISTRYFPKLFETEREKVKNKSQECHLLFHNHRYVDFQNQAFSYCVNSVLFEQQL